MAMETYWNLTRCPICGRSVEREDMVEVDYTTNTCLHADEEDGS